MNYLSVLKTIKTNKNFVVTTHVNPDVDALTSQCAMAVFLNSLGKNVKLLNEAPLPKRFQFLPASHWVKAYQSNTSINVEVLVALDCGELDRIGKVKKIINSSTRIINIDHHITNDNFGHHNIVRAGSSSTAELLFDLFKTWKYRISKDVAILLYLGIMTDTGSFRYENTTAHTHSVISELLKWDIPVSELYRKLYESLKMRDVKKFIRVINSFESFSNEQIICLELKKNISNQFSKDFDLRDKIFQHLRSIRGAEIFAILTEIEKNKTRVNLRSQRRVNVAKIAAQFKGGGHPRASGCLLEHNMKDAKKTLLRSLRKAL